MSSTLLRKVLRQVEASKRREALSCMPTGDGGGYVGVCTAMDEIIAYSNAIFDAREAALRRADEARHALKAANCEVYRLGKQLQRAKHAIEKYSLTCAQHGEGDSHA